MVRSRPLVLALVLVPTLARARARSEALRVDGRRADHGVPRDRRGAREAGAPLAELLGFSGEFN